MREDYELFIFRANIRDAIAINDFLNPAVEEEILQEMEEEEFEQLLLKAAETTGVGEEQEATENMVYTPTYPSRSNLNHWR